ncbi:MAG: Asp23/Gls24 family envelope stress response protein [Christensenellaceae bacterium]|jgi:uncharacterized alkaline shock family protein YloU|nr:Asp23/Gls24 family envelope stress response protein [Christensenellaceae bacterium]
MALHTNNLYGKITITKRTIRTIAAKSAFDCYGVWALGKNITERNINQEWKLRQGVRVWSQNNKIGIFINVILSYGVSHEAVIESLRSAIKYNVENFAGMQVSFINIYISSVNK